MIFDLLAVEGSPVMQLPYTERRRLLDDLALKSPSVQLVPSLDDGEALWHVVCELGLEGVVAKRERDPYRPGERLWVKTKNKTTQRFQEELAGARRRARR